MSAKKLSLNVFQNCLAQKGFAVKFHYDRIKLYVDSASRQSQLEQASAGNEKHNIIARALSHHDTMVLMIDARQPNKAYLKRLGKAVVGDCVVNYVEFAMDIIGDDAGPVAKLRTLLNGLLTFERNSKQGRYFYYNHSEETYYFGNRYNHKEVLVVYSDKDSKIAKGQPCVHIELRLYGSEIIKKQGLYTIEDLVDVSHQQIWDKYLDLRDVSYTELGRLVSPTKKDLVDSSLLRHGKKFFDKFGGSQALLNEHPHLAEAFTPIQERRKFESRLDKALG
jgi:hypothetical protein